MSQRRVERIRQYVSERAPEIEREIRRQKELRKKFTYFSDIVSAIEQGAVLLKTDREESWSDAAWRFVAGAPHLVSDNMLVLFSDMIQESSDYNFATAAGPDAREASRIVKELRKRGRIPNLAGRKVFVNGRTGSSNAQVDSIGRFWLEYFRATGAELVAYGFDSGQEIKSYLLDRRRGC
jgi:hypothetical protein